MFLHKIVRHITKRRLNPISVYCFHHVCSEFNKDSMNGGDWMDINVFKEKIQELRNNGYEFISLSAAYKHISSDFIRTKKYAVVTFDDGYASLKEIIPWLEQEHILYTLFINGKYLDGVSYRTNPSEQYLTKNDLFALDGDFIEIGSHGWEHNDASIMNVEEFQQTIQQEIDMLSCHPCYIPFWAYTWGKHNAIIDGCLRRNNIVPVLMDGMKNYNDKMFIHREMIQI